MKIFKEGSPLTQNINKKGLKKPQRFGKFKNVEEKEIKAYNCKAIKCYLDIFMNTEDHSNDIGVLIELHLKS